MATNTTPPRIGSDIEASSPINDKDEKEAPVFHYEEVMDVSDLVRAVDQEAERRSVSTPSLWWLSAMTAT